MPRTENPAFAKGLRSRSRLLAVRLEERALHDGRRDPMPFPFDRDLDSDTRAGFRVRRCDGRDRDVFLQERRPATARGPADLAITRKEGDLLPPRRGRRVRREANVPLEFIHSDPVDDEAHRAAYEPAAILIAQSLAS